MNTTYRKILNDEFERRKTKNPLYSMRAYSRDLDISGTHLRDVLSGKNHISTDRAAKMVDRLNLSPMDSELFLDLVEVESSANEVAKVRAQRRLDARFASWNVLSQEEFSVISEWYFMPLMELFSTNLKDHAPETLALRLNLPKATIETALETLIRHNFIHENKGQFVVNHENTTSNNIPSSTIRNYYRQVLKQAENAIEGQTLERRDFSVLTVAIDKKRIPVLKERISRFRRELNLEMADSSCKDAVYTLSICLFQNTKDLQ